MTLNPEELGRELDDELDGIDPSEDAQPPDDLADLAQAVRFADRYRRALDDLTTLMAVADDRKAEIDAWVERRSNPIVRRIRYHGHGLEGWARRVIGDRKRNKYEDVAGLRLSLRQMYRPHVDVRDEAAFLDWVDKTFDEDVTGSLMFLDYVPEQVIPAHYKVSTEMVADRLDLSPTAIPVGDRQEREFLFEGETVPGVVLVEQQRDKFDIKPTIEKDEN